MMYCSLHVKFSVLAFSSDVCLCTKTSAIITIKHSKFDITFSNIFNFKCHAHFPKKALISIFIQYFNI